jgi:hypothetical protein
MTLDHRRQRTVLASAPLGVTCLGLGLASRLAVGADRLAVSVGTALETQTSLAPTLT